MRVGRGAHWREEEEQHGKRAGCAGGKKRSNMRVDNRVCSKPDKRREAGLTEIEKEKKSISPIITRPFGPRRKAWSAGPRRDIVVA